MQWFEGATPVSLLCQPAHRKSLVVATWCGRPSGVSASGPITSRHGKSIPETGQKRNEHNDLVRASVHGLRRAAAPMFSAVRCMGPGLGCRRLDGVASLLPRGKATQEGLDIGKALSQQALCHTGTLLFLTSGAVEDPLLVLGQIAQSGFDLIFGNGNRPCSMQFVVGCPATNVHQDGGAPLEPLPGLLERDAGDVGIGGRVRGQGLCCAARH